MTQTFGKNSSLIFLPLSRTCNFQASFFPFLQFATTIVEKQIRMARMTPNEANKKPFVIIRVMGSEARDFYGWGLSSGHGILFRTLRHGVCYY